MDPLAARQVRSEEVLMRENTVADVMTRDVVRAAPDTPYKDLVDFVVGEAISAVPVVDARGALVGVVSEADLLCKQEFHDADKAPASFAGRRVRLAWRKAAALTARDLMAGPVATIALDASVTVAAGRLLRSGLRRLFVVDSGRLVGVLARRDILRGFLRGDSDIQSEIERDVFDGRLGADPRMVRVTVADGVVWLTGRLEYQGDMAIAEHLSRRVPGVVGVRNRLDYFWSGPGPRAATDAGPVPPHRPAAVTGTATR
jgi:CBS domain-containing protein